MKKPLLVAAMLLASLPFAFSQDTSRAAVKFYGFVRNYYTLDSRRTYTVVGGEYNMVPYDIDTVDGVDLNDVPVGQLQALTSRFGVDLRGPRLGGWTSSGKLEADFGGFGSNNTVLRLRLAYLKLSRPGHELVVGQDWHPLSGSIMPEVLGMAAGAPFRPHSRTPQVRYAFSRGALGCTAALLWQLQYMNNGPTSATNPASMASTAFAHRSLVPECFVGLDFRQGAWYAHAGVDMQQLTPRTHAQVGGTMRRVHETVFSVTPTLYVQYVEGLWSVKSRALLAQNTSHLNQLVGYAVTGVAADGSWEYSPMNAAIAYLNVACGRTVRGDLFVGYMKNLGAGKELYSFGGDYLIYMKGGGDFVHLNSVWRLAPSLSYNVRAFNIGMEYELTACTYGDMGPRGQIVLNDRLHQVVNHRLCALVKYNF